MENKSGRADRRTKTSSLNGPHASGHPYAGYESTKLWKTLDQAIADLVKNRDLEERTTRSHLVGYLCKKLVSNDLVTVRTTKALNKATKSRLTR